MIVQLWTAALRNAGYTWDATERVILDIREVSNGPNAALEVIKYLTKDVMPDRTLVPEGTVAEVYKALDGKRRIQASAGFFKNIDTGAQCACGAVGCFVRLSEPPADPREVNP
jgi:hypothetical protein